MGGPRWAQGGPKFDVGGCAVPIASFKPSKTDGWCKMAYPGISPQAWCAKSGTNAPRRRHLDRNAPVSRAPATRAPIIEQWVKMGLPPAGGGSAGSEIRIAGVSPAARGVHTMGALMRGDADQQLEPAHLEGRIGLYAGGDALAVSFSGAVQGPRSARSPTETAPRAAPQTSREKHLAEKTRGVFRGGQSRCARSSRWPAI